MQIYTQLFFISILTNKLLIAHLLFHQSPLEEIYGDKCQCDTYSCERYKGLPCGGPAQGVCKCHNNTGLNYCQCNPGWSGSNCGCEKNAKKCVSPDGVS